MHLNYKSFCLYTITALLCACSLSEPCGNNTHFGQSGECEEDTPRSCGIPTIDCKNIEGALFIEPNSGQAGNTGPKGLTTQCIDGKCLFECDEESGYFHEINGDYSSKCVPRCLCERDPATGKITDPECLATHDEGVYNKIISCVTAIRKNCDNKLSAIDDTSIDKPDNVPNPEWNVRNTYCVENTDDFLLLDD